MKFLELMTELAKRAGVDTASEELAPIFNSEELAKASVGEETAAQFKGLMSREVAFNDPEIKRHFTAQTLNGFDKSMKDSLKKQGWDDAQIDEFWKAREGKTGRVAHDLVAHLNEQIAQAGNDEDAKKKVAKLREEREQAIKNAEELKAQNEQIQQESKEKMNEVMVNMNLRSQLNKMPKPKGLSEKAWEHATQGVLSEELRKKGAAFRVDENGELYLAQKDDPNSRFAENNAFVKPDEFIRSALSEHELLAKSPGNDPAGTQGNPAPPRQVDANPNPGQGGGAPSPNQQTIAAQNPAFAQAVEAAQSE